MYRRQSRAVVLSGCSGGGKSTVLEHPAAHGYRTVDEPGRRIVRQELRTGGHALPWEHADRFARACIDLARVDREDVVADRWTFFDRGLVDADTALRHHAGRSACSIEELQNYHARVFMTPPWPELYAADDERQLGLDEAVSEYGRLLRRYDELGYSITVLPKVSVAERAELILAELGLRG